MIENIAKFSFDTAEGQAQLAALIKNLDKLDRAADKAEKGTEAHTKATTAAGAAHAKLKTVLYKESKTLNGMKARLDGLRAAQGKVNTESREFIAISKKIDKQVKDIAKATGGADKSAVSLAESLKATGTQFLLVTAAGVGFAAVNDVLNQAAEKSKLLNTQLGDIQTKFKDLSTAEVEDIAVNIKGNEAGLGVGFDETLKGINSVVKSSGENVTSVSKDYEAALLRASSSFRSEFNNINNEFGEFFEKSGISAKQQFALLLKGDELDVYGSTVGDFIEEISITLTEQNKGLSDSLTDVFGKDYTKDIFKGIKNQDLTPFQAVQQIAKDLENTDINPQQYQKLTAALATSSGERGGKALLGIIADLGDGTEVLNSKLSEYQLQTAKTVELNKELARAEIELNKELGETLAAYSNMSLELKTNTLIVINDLIKNFKELPDFLGRNRAELVTLATVFGVVGLAMNGVTVATVQARLASAALSVGMIRQRAVALLTAAGNGALITSLKALRLAALTNPFTAILVGVVALISAYRIFNRESAKVTAQREKEAETAKRTADITKNLTKAYTSQRGELDKLFKPLADVTAGTKEKAAAITEITKRYPDYLTAIDKQNLKLGKTSEVYEKLNGLILENIVNQEIQSRTAESVQKIAELSIERAAAVAANVTNIQNTGLSDNIRYLESVQNSGKVLLNIIDGKIRDEKDKIKGNESIIKDAIKNIQGALKGFDLSALGTAATSATGGGKTGLSKTTKEVKEEAKILKTSIAQIKNDLSDLQRQLQEQTDVNDAPAVASVSVKISTQIKLLEAAEESLARALSNRVAVDPSTLNPISTNPVPASVAPSGGLLERDGADRAVRDLELLQVQKLRFLEESRNEELNAANLTAEQKLRIDEKYNNKRSLLEKKTTAEILRAKLAVLNLDLATGKDIPKVTKEIEDLRLELAKLEGEVIDIEITADTEKAKATMSEVLDAVGGLTGEVFGLINTVFDSSINAMTSAADRQKSVLDSMLNNTETSNAEQVKLEKERLEELEAARRKAVEKQQNLAIIEVIANSLIAISRAAAEGGALAPITIAATLAALAGGLAAAKAQSSQAFFYGTEYVTRSAGEPAGRDTVRAFLNEGERVMTTEKNQQYGPVLNAISRGQIAPEILNQFVKSPTLKTAGGQAFGGVVEMQQQFNILALEQKADFDRLAANIDNSLRRTVGRMPKVDITMDSKGFSKKMTSYSNEAARRAKRHG